LLLLLLLGEEGEAAWVRAESTSGSFTVGDDVIFLGASFPDAASEALPDFGAFLRPDFTSGPRDEAEEEEEASLRGEEEEEEEKGAWRQEATKLVKSSITKVSSTSFVDP